VSTEGTTLRSAPRGLTGADRLPRHLFGALFTSHASAERTRPFIQGPRGVMIRQSVYGGVRYGPC
jgi:hypothetical protein